MAKKSSSKKTPTAKSKEAAEALAAQKRKEGKEATIIGVIVVIIIVCLIAFGAFNIYNSHKKTENAEQTAYSKFLAVKTKPKSISTDGALVYDKNGFVKNPASLDKSKKIRVDSYMDLNCPGCQYTESTLADSYDNFLANGTIVLRLHVLSMLDYTSTDNYSDRAGIMVLNASDIDGNKTMALIRELYADGTFPGESTEYKPTSDEKLAKSAMKVGFTAKQAKSIMYKNNKKYMPYLKAYTDWLTSRKDMLNDQTNTFTTPIVTVNNKRINNSADDLTQEFTNRVLESKTSASTTK